jgi:hypothetical protein
VQLGARGLRDPVVGRIPDEQVAESERIDLRVIGSLAPDELLAEESAHAQIDVTRPIAGQDAHGGGIEDLPHHGGDVDQSSFPGG